MTPDDYIKAHQGYYAQKYPDAFKAGHWPVPKVPPIDSDRFKNNYQRWIQALGNNVTTQRDISGSANTDLT